MRRLLTRDDKAGYGGIGLTASQERPPFRLEGEGQFHPSFVPSLDAHGRRGHLSDTIMTCSVVVPTFFAE